MPVWKNMAAGCQQGCRRSVLPRNSCVQHCSSARRGDKKCLSLVACRPEHAFSVVSSSLHPAGRKGKIVQKKNLRGLQGTGRGILILWERKEAQIQTIVPLPSLAELSSLDIWLQTVISRTRTLFNYNWIFRAL